MKDFICEKCKVKSTGFNNQRFCLKCKDENNSEKKKANDKRYYRENLEDLKAKQRERWKKNYVPHPKKLLSKKEKKEKTRTYAQRNRNKINENKRIWRLNNYEKNLKSNREYQKKNADRIRQNRISNLPTRRKRNSFYFQKYNKDPIFNIKNKLRNRLWYAMTTYCKNGKIMKSKDYGIDYEKIIKYLKPFPKDIYKYHIDHIKPLCSFDLTNIEEVKKAFAPENHQWLTIEENLKKSSKLI
jgi:hypothetical protein